MHLIACPNICQTFGLTCVLQNTYHIIRHFIQHKPIWAPIKRTSPAFVNETPSQFGVCVYRFFGHKDMAKSIHVKIEQSNLHLFSILAVKWVNTCPCWFLGNDVDLKAVLFIFHMMTEISMHTLLLYVKLYSVDGFCSLFMTRQYRKTFLSMTTKESTGVKWQHSSSYLSVTENSKLQPVSKLVFRHILRLMVLHRHLGVQVIFEMRSIKNILWSKLSRRAFWSLVPWVPRIWNFIGKQTAPTLKIL